MDTMAEKVVDLAVWVSYQCYFVLSPFLSNTFYEVNDGCVCLFHSKQLETTCDASAFNWLELLRTYRGGSIKRLVGSCTDE